MTATRSSGFTLIELMIVVAIIAILAAIAIPAYENYIREARMAKVVAHYDEAIRLVRNEVAKNAAVQARGRPAILPGDSAGWLPIVNPENQATAPLGALPAYGVAVNNEAGIIGIEYDDVRRVVIVTRPSYLDLNQQSVARETIDIH